MSNIGKSHWARQRLEAESGFRRICCDDLIEEKLASELTRLGYKGIEDVAKWMGHPYETRYAETSRKYMQFEREVMLEIIELLKSKPSQPMVIDTTGSVIYAGDDIANELWSLTTVIYLQESHHHVQELFEHYMINPKPVYWGDSFQPLPDEAHRDSLRRCFPDLLHFRSARYQAMAHLHIPFDRHRAAGATWENLMREARQVQA